jgi:hypothetical protein
MPDDLLQQAERRLAELKAKEQEDSLLAEAEARLARMKAAPKTAPDRTATRKPAAPLSQIATKSAKKPAATSGASLSFTGEPTHIEEAASRLYAPQAKAKERPAPATKQKPLDLRPQETEVQRLARKAEQAKPRRLVHKETRVSAAKKKGVIDTGKEAIAKVGEVVSAPFRKVDEMVARAILESGGGTGEAQANYLAAMERNPMGGGGLREQTFWQSLDPETARILSHASDVPGGISRFGMNLLTPSSAIPIGGVASKVPLLSRASALAFGVPAAAQGVEQIGRGGAGNTVEGLLNLAAGAVGAKHAATPTPKPKATYLPIKTTDRSLQMLSGETPAGNPVPAPESAPISPPVRDTNLTGGPENAQTPQGRVISPVESVPIGETNVQPVAGVGVPVQPLPGMATKVGATGKPLPKEVPTPESAIRPEQVAASPDAQAPLTGAKNLTTEAERAARGQSPVERQAYTLVGEAYNQGRAAVESGEIDARALAASVARIPRTLDARDIGALAYDRAQIIKEHDATTEALAKAVDAGDANTIATLQTKQEQLLAALDDNDQALVKGGREQSAAFAARKLMVGQDFSFAGVQQRAKANKGAPLTPQERTQFEALTAKLKEAETRLADAERAIAEGKPVTRQNASAKGVPRLKLQLTAEETAKVADVKKRIAAKGMQVGSAPDVTILADVVELGGIYLKAGLRSYKEWRAQMAEDLPNADEATLQRAWASVKAEDAPSRKTSFKAPDNLTESLARKLGWEKANDFLDAISDNGDPAILRRLLNGEELTTAEKSRIVDAWHANAPAKQTGGSKVAAVQALSQIVKEARQYKPPKPPTPQQREKAQVKRLTGQIQDFTSRIQQGNFTLPGRPTPAPPSAQVKQLQAQRDLLKAQIQARIDAVKPRTLGQKVAEVVSVPRSLLTSFDLSAPLRQGSVLTLANPRLAVKNIGPMLRAFAKEETGQIIDNEIRARPNFPDYEASGLYVAPLNEITHLSRREEAFMSTLAERIPGVRASERAYVTYLNKLRADSFDMFKGQLPNATPQELAAVADFINTATGRGKLGATGERAATLLNNVFFSPRYLTSRVQLLAGEPLYRGTARTRGLVARTYLQYAGAVFAVVQLAKAGGAEVETDPRHTDFLKLKFGGNKVFDVLAGLQQAGTFIARFATKEKTSAADNTTQLNDPEAFKGDTRADLTIDFLRGKAAPVPGSMWNLMAGSNIVGQPTSLGGEAARLVIPMSWPDVYAAAKEEGMPQASAIFLMSLFGVGAQYRQPMEKKPGKASSSGSSSMIPKPPKIDLPKVPTFR